MNDEYINSWISTSDQDRIFRYNINKISTRQLERIKTNTNLGIISWSNTKFSELTLRIVWLTVRRITNLIWIKSLHQTFDSVSVSGFVMLLWDLWNDKNRHYFRILSFCHNFARGKPFRGSNSNWISIFTPNIWLPFSFLVILRFSLTFFPRIWCFIQRRPSY